MMNFVVWRVFDNLIILSLLDFDVVSIDSYCITTLKSELDYPKEILALASTE